MAAYRRICDSRHLQADCQEPVSAAEPYYIDSLNQRFGNSENEKNPPKRKNRFFYIAIFLKHKNISSDAYGTTVPRTEVLRILSDIVVDASHRSPSAQLPRQIFDKSIIIPGLCRGPADRPTPVTSDGAVEPFIITCAVCRCMACTRLLLSSLKGMCALVGPLQSPLPYAPSVRYRSCRLLDYCRQPKGLSTSTRAWWRNG